MAKGLRPVISWAFSISTGHNFTEKPAISWCIFLWGSCVICVPSSSWMSCIVGPRLNRRAKLGWIRRFAGVMGDHGVGVTMPGAVGRYSWFVWSCKYRRFMAICVLLFLKKICLPFLPPSGRRVNQFFFSEYFAKSFFSFNEAADTPVKFSIDISKNRNFVLKGVAIFHYHFEYRSNWLPIIP